MLAVYVRGKALSGPRVFRSVSIPQNGTPKFHNENSVTGVLMHSVAATFACFTLSGHSGQLLTLYSSNEEIRRLGREAYCKHISVGNR